MLEQYWSLWVKSPLVFGLFGLVIAAFFYFRVKSLEKGNETMERIAGYIREGAMAFLWRQYKALFLYGLIVFVFVKNLQPNRKY